MNNGIQSITVFGDSILKGAVTGDGMIHMFEIIEDNSLNLAQKELGFELDNHSIFGNIITKGKKKFDRWIENGGTADLCIIEFGGNDCDWDWPPVSENPDIAHDQKVPLPLYLKTLDEMIKTCRAHKITPLIMTMPSIVADRWFEHICIGNNKENILKFLGGDPTKLYRAHERYNMALLKYAYENNVQIVDMRMAMLNHQDYRQIMCQDGIHPNQEGYKYMSQIWIEQLPEIKKEF